SECALGARMGDAQLRLLVAHVLPRRLALGEGFGGLLPLHAVLAQAVLELAALHARTLRVVARALDERTQVTAAPFQVLAHLLGAAALPAARSLVGVCALQLQ